MCLQASRASRAPSRDPSRRASRASFADLDGAGNQEDNDGGAHSSGAGRTSRRSLGDRSFGGVGQASSASRSLIQFNVDDLENEPEAGGEGGSGDGGRDTDGVARARLPPVGGVSMGAASTRLVGAHGWFGRCR